ncbi:MAG: ABC transporter substrate-binding protein [Bacteroidales bacterium]|jgi:iron complex transport system substrate-binding protein|nr:ABC transporter substrate-binding protein [Bacteroidales bacterium]
MKSLYRILLLPAIWLFVLASCGDNGKKSNQNEPIEIYDPQYATGFRILYYQDYKVLETKKERYYLFKDRKTKVEKDSIVIRIPVNSMACMAQSQWAAAVILGEMESITGMCDAKYIHDSLFRERLSAGLIKNIAVNQTINYELLLTLQPQLLMLSFDNMQSIGMLQNIGIPVIVNSDFLENHPLGRAEWLIFIAALYDKDEQAKEFFNRSVQRYHAFAELATTEHYRPTVFDGSEANGIWYVSGGQSYMARFYQDAGADYLWKQNNDAASIPLDFEAVYYKGLSADFWRAYLPYAKDYDELKRENSHYADLKAWKERKIFYCDNLHTDLFGIGVYQPEVILADMIKVFYPARLPEHQPKYYDFLKE